MIKLDGKWLLYPIPSEDKVDKPEQLEKFEAIPAEVPGNVELDLINAGMLPKDIYKGMNIKLAEEYELYDWWYKTEFKTPEFSNCLKIRFEGVDCFAQYWLNGVIIGESDNMLVPYELDITDCVNEIGEKNILYIKISSAINQANSLNYDLYNIDSHPQPNADGISIRKPPHCFGWDIMPRAVSAGIWKSVVLYEKDKLSINQIHYHIISCNEKEAKIRFLWELDIPSEFLKKEIYLTVRGKCENSEFGFCEKIYFKLGKKEITIKNPKLWWPKGYGTPSIYDTEITVECDEYSQTKKINVGLRTVMLDRTAHTDGKNGRFEFVLNGVGIMCKGTNWVPLDVYHSRDIARYEKALALLDDIGCNIVRCWGGNVYEQDIFYDFCDKHGIMIWQDFTMACAGYSLNADFCEKIDKEATYVVRNLRSHPSIVLWAGDNECDAVMSEFGTDPTKNKINREILPMVIHKNDNGRPYLPSSPCFEDGAHIGNNIDILSEYHLWGPRDYYKSDYYKQSKAHFVSEVGYHGCPSPKSLERFIDKEFLWPYTNNQQWNLHSSDQRNNPARVELVANQIKQLFGKVPDNLDDFSFASQISQAEAKKYFIERIRAKKPVKSGVIWWNLLDGWPQISDAVVDYYFEKKLAYDYIKRSQEPFVILIDEIADWNLSVIASNDTLREISGSYKIMELSTNAIIIEDAFNVKENSNLTLGKIPVMYSDKGMLLIEWQIGDKKYYNHYLYGYPAFDLDEYKKWYEILKNRGV